MSKGKQHKLRHVRTVYEIEYLEGRRLLAAVAWDGGGDGINWTDPLNWSTNAVPTGSDDVTIAVAPVGPQIRIASGNNSVNSLSTTQPVLLIVQLQISANLDVEGTTLEIGSQSSTNSTGSVHFNGSDAPSISGNGTIQITGTNAGIFCDNL